ncbi:MAG: hypothetical protein FJ385_09200 [Verrucomicrobia bacterium]|jgi:predicted DNA-binding protein|nr:hypothetical protein [Verrucomicrobiota bacterium]
MPSKPAKAIAALRIDAEMMDRVIDAAVRTGLSQADIMRLTIEMSLSDMKRFLDRAADVKRTRPGRPSRR